MTKKTLIQGELYSLVIRKNNVDNRSNLYINNVRVAYFLKRIDGWAVIPDFLYVKNLGDFILSDGFYSREKAMKYLINSLDLDLLSGITYQQKEFNFE